MHFGEHLREERKKLNLSADKLAKKCDVSRSYITLIENGKRLPGKKIIPKLAGALNLKVNVMIDWYLEDTRKRLGL